jgi:hypothetical protein
MRKRARAKKAKERRQSEKLDGAELRVLFGLPDEAFVTDAESSMITRLSRTSIWRIEHGLDRNGRKAFPPEPLLKSIKIGPKRKVRRLGDLRKFVRQREEASGVVGTCEVRHDH